MSNKENNGPLAVEQPAAVDQITQTWWFVAGTSLLAGGALGFFLKHGDRNVGLAACFVYVAFTYYCVPANRRLAAWTICAVFGIAFGHLIGAYG